MTQDIAFYVAASLLPGGRFAWDAFAFDHEIAARLDGRLLDADDIRSKGGTYPTTRHDGKRWISSRAASLAHDEPPIPS
jgi:hypothetical protein